MSLHPRNDQSRFHDSQTYLGGSTNYPAGTQYDRYVQPEHGKLPNSQITSERLDRARIALDVIVLGVSSRDILASVIELPWIFEGICSLRDIAVTKHLIQLNPEIASQYKAMQSSEGFLEKLYTCLPFVTDSRKSTQFLRSLSCLNDLIDTMVKEGLINSNHRMFVGSSYALAGGHPLPGPVIQSLMVSATDIGKLAMRL